MQRPFPKINSSFALEFLRGKIRGTKFPTQTGYDVFLSHRRIDTRRTVAGLLHDRLTRIGLRPFLDSKSMSPGDRLFERIDAAVLECKLGVAILSPRYCNSYYCLHELALMMEARKKVIPIFCDVKPSELRVSDSVICSPDEARKFNAALEEARNIVGITFDSQNEDWLELLKSASNVISQELGNNGHKYHHARSRFGRKFICSHETVFRKKTRQHGGVN